jgi:hypothetical protein
MHPRYAVAGKEDLEPDANAAGLASLRTDISQPENCVEERASKWYGFCHAPYCGGLMYSGVSQ